MHLTPQAQERLKIDLIERAFRGAVPSFPMRFVPSPSVLSYRCRATYVVERRPGGTVRLGSYAPRTHEVARMDGCLVVRPTIARVAAELAKRIAQSGAPIHPEREGLRFLALRSGAEKGAVAELVVTSQAASRWAYPLSQEWVNEGLLCGVSLSVNDRETDAIKVAGATCLSGVPTVTDHVGAFALELEAGGFSQLNLEVAAAMYGKAAQFAGRASVLWDLYAGPGALGLTVASQCNGQKIYGAESVEASVVQARQAAARLGIEANYEACNLALGIPHAWPRPDVALVNPPRRGMDRAALDRLSEVRPPVIVYMSCRPSSFVRDVAILGLSGYRITDIEAHDMLPQTAHVELVARLVTSAGSSHPV
jgi:23S rRNA (uracil1939-C5)-methyltransferase